MDTNKEIQVEILALNGLTPVLTVNDYTRINRAIVYTSGATESNEGLISFSSEAQTSSSGKPTTLLYSCIGANAAFSQVAIYTTPLNVTNTVIGNVSVSTNVVGTGELSLYVESRRPLTGSAWLRTANIPISIGTSTFNIEGSGIYSAGTDIRLRAQANGQNTDIQVYYVLMNYTAQ